MLKRDKTRKYSQQSSSPALTKVRKGVRKQAAMVVLLLVLTVVILFAVTAAWYTNIVQSSGLVFEAAVWGFSGDVTLNAQALTAAPGDEGVVELTAVSESDGLTAVGVNVSKAQMTETMQQRIYFYADTGRVKNGESMERIYLNDNTSYTYLLFGRGELILTEEQHNDVLIKWHWVYDVLGYYVEGKWDEENQRMTVSQYLRPIEYNYDEAVTTFDENGNLLTVDGSTTTAEFLYQLSLTDGYEGTIGTAGEDGTITLPESSGGYYPVSVDENGNGVWAYLCNATEIEMNTITDTQLGQAAGTEDGATYVAKVTVTAQNATQSAIAVTTPSGLLDALEQGSADGEQAVVQMESDIVLSQALTVGEDGESQQVMLDLNGYSLTLESSTYSSKQAAIQVAEGSTLTVLNGELSGTGAGIGVTGAGGNVTLVGVTFTNVETALYIRDTDADGGDATIRLYGCVINCSEEGIFLSGNGDASAQTTQLVVENSVIKSGYAGIMSNGSLDRRGTDIQVINSNIYGRYTGIYHPQDAGTLTVSNSTISGYNGITVKGGDVTLVDSVVTGLGTASTPTSATGSGFELTGDAVYIESNYGYDISLTVDGSILSTNDENALALRIFPSESNVAVSLISGTFSSEVDESWLGEYSVCETADGLWLVSIPAGAGEETGSTVLPEEEQSDDEQSTDEESGGDE